MNRYPTTCTTCRAPFDAGFFVVSDQEIRLCPGCEERAMHDGWLRDLERSLADSRVKVTYYEQEIIAHKAAYPPLVKLGQGEYEREIHK